MSDLEDRETVLARNQLGRKSIRPSSFRKTFINSEVLTSQQQQRRPITVGSDFNKTCFGTTTPSTGSPSTPDGLKQWELVEGDAGLKVVEKKKTNSNSNSLCGSPVLNTPKPPYRSRIGGGSSGGNNNCGNCSGRTTTTPLFVNEGNKNSIVTQNIQDFEKALRNTKFRKFATGGAEGGDENDDDDDDRLQKKNVKLDVILNKNIYSPSRLNNDDHCYNYNSYRNDNNNATIMKKIYNNRDDDNNCNKNEKRETKKGNFSQSGGGSISNSTDMLDQLERQVKAIEQGTLDAAAARLEEKVKEVEDIEENDKRGREMNNYSSTSSRNNDTGSSEAKIDQNQVELRYREHEDLLGNNTDDEAER